MPVQLIAKIQQKNDGTFKLVDIADLDTGDLDVVMSIIAGGGIIAGVDATAPEGEIAVQRKTTTGAPDHVATAATLCWNGVDEVLYTSRGDGTWVVVGGGAHPDLATHDALGLATDDELAAHTDDASDAHAASAVTFTPAVGIAATNAQAAIAEALIDAKSYADDGHLIATSLRGAVDGVAELDGDGKVPAAELPSIAFGATYVVASEAAMLALAAVPGDVAVRTDEGKSYILAAADPTDIDNWVELLFPAGGAVTSVNARTGDVTGLEEASNKGAISGYASLDGSGTVPDAQIPAAITRDTELTAYVPKSLVDAKGDVFAGSAPDTLVRVPVGDEGTQLQSDPTGDGGIGWSFHRFRLEVDIRGYGAEIGDASATFAAIMSAIDDVHDGKAQKVVIPATGNASDVWTFDDTLIVPSGTWLSGGGVMGITNAAGRLRYTGADATNAIETSGETSRMRLTGIDLRDSRVGATSGDGIHLTTTNGLLLEHCQFANFPDRQAYLGNSAGTPDNYAVDYCWFGGGEYGVYLDHNAESVMLRFIMGDSNPGSPNGFEYLVGIGTQTTGWSNILIDGAKVEGDYGGIVEVTSGYVGNVIIRGLQKGQGPSTNPMVKTSAANANVKVEAAVTTDANQVIVEDAVNTRSWATTALSKGRVFPSVEIINNVDGHPHQVVGQQAGNVTPLSADTTLNATHDTVVVTTGTTNKTITLPSLLSSAFGWRYVIKKADSATGAVVIAGTIDGDTNRTLLYENQYVEVQRGASQWNVVAEGGAGLVYDPTLKVLTASDGAQVEMA